MAKFLVCFRVEQLLSGSIEVEAESAAEARALFEHPSPWDCPRAQRADDARLEAKLELEDSEDSITEIQNMETGKSYVVSS